MNILHMKYAVEVARLGSLNRAAETLLVAQPNISRSIKELEADIGITIFNRSARGMTLTRDGEDFISYAKDILNQIERVEEIYKHGATHRESFSLCAVYAPYICEAFTAFSANLGNNSDVNLSVRSSENVIRAVLRDDCMLGIIRYCEESDKSIKQMLDEKGLSYELLCEFSFRLTTSEESHISVDSGTHRSDLYPYIEYTSSDIFSPLKKCSCEEDAPDGYGKRRIFVANGMHPAEILDDNPNGYMYLMPISQKTLKKYHLVQHGNDLTSKRYRDVLIYKEGYTLRTLDRDFITVLCRVKREHFN